MAVLWVTEYNAPADYSAPKEPAVRTQTVTFTTSVQSLVFTEETRCVRVVADADCHLLFGLNPTATTGHQRLTAEVAELRHVKPGDKVAAIAAA